MTGIIVSGLNGSWLAGAEAGEGEAIAAFAAADAAAAGCADPDVAVDDEPVRAWLILTS